jgi:hypothetical protein
VLPQVVESVVGRYLEFADRLLPGRVTGFYVVGSVALEAFRPGRSDIDFVAVLDGRPGRGELGRIRLLHLAAGAWTGWTALSHGRSVVSGTCNGVFIRAGDLSRPVTQIVPVASHTGLEFHVDRAFEVNPVVWKVLAERGVTIRGPAPDTLGLLPQGELLRDWNLGNLQSYWRAWAETTLAQGNRLGWRLRPRWTTAWGVLGAPRLHHTIATGEIISKEAAGEYAMEAFDRHWRPIIDEGLRYWRGEPPNPAFADPAVRSRRTAEFVLEVVRSAKDGRSPGRPGEPGHGGPPRAPR